MKNYLGTTTKKSNPGEPLLVKAVVPIFIIGM